MPKFGVTPGKEAELLERMARCDLRETDLEEKFVTSQGPGGQHVNRSATCVQLRHTPTGLTVRAQDSRSQALNRFYARRRMCALLEARRDGTATPEAARQAKLRKQKARRRRRSRAKGTEDGANDAQ